MSYTVIPEGFAKHKYFSDLIIGNYLVKNIASSGLFSFGIIKFEDFVVGSNLERLESGNIVSMGKIMSKQEIGPMYKNENYAIELTLALNDNTFTHRISFTMDNILSMKYRQNITTDSFGHIYFNDFIIGNNLERLVSKKIVPMGKIISKEQVGRPYDYDIELTLEKDGNEHTHIIYFARSYRQRTA